MPYFLGKIILTITIKDYILKHTNPIKLLLLIASLLLFSISLSFSSEDYIANSSRSISETINEKTKEKAFYNKGFDDGFSNGEEIGYAKAVAANEKSIERYKNYIMSLEAGKYLSKKGKITPPRIYQESRSDGSISVTVRGCNIEGELSPEDILSFPSYAGEVTQSRSSQSKYKEGGKSDSVFLAGIDRKRKISRPEASEDGVRGTFKTFPDTSFYRKLFHASDLIFSIQSDKQIRVMFKSEQEALGFVRRHRLEEGKDYN